jgi:hypothetical protein
MRKVSRAVPRAAGWLELSARPATGKGFGLRILGKKGVNSVAEQGGLLARQGPLW